MACLNIPIQQVDSIEILFEFCPEKKTVFSVNAKENHSFEIVPEPWLMEIFFHNFSLQLTKTGLAGGHPLSDKTTSLTESINPLKPRMYKQRSS